MSKKISLVLAASLIGSSLYAGVCSDGLKVNFTFFGAPDKSYIVTQNTFKTIKSDFPADKLLNSTLSIDGSSIDTSKDLNNLSKKWPAAMINVRNMNIKNHFFKKIPNNPSVVNAKVVSVDDSKIVAEVDLNGQKQSVDFTYKIEADTLKAVGKLDVAKFGLEDVWTKFSKTCAAFHHGKSWSELEVHFEVPASCK